MRSGRTTWLSGIGAAVLIGGLVLANYGGGVTPAGATGGGQDGNPTLRWDQVLPAAHRFVILAAFNNEAVLDRETGLVWEKSPTTTLATPQDWFAARFICAGQKFVGGRGGWRLPSIPELASLVDATTIHPTLPKGHPFTNVQAASSQDAYWSATTSAENPTRAWGVGFFHGDVGDSTDKTGGHQVWCVRGGMNADAY